MAISPSSTVPVAVVMNIDSPLVMLRPMAPSTPPRPFFLELRPPEISTPREYTMLPFSILTDSPRESARRAIGQSESPVSTNLIRSPFKGKQAPLSMESNDADSIRSRLERAKA